MSTLTNPANYQDIDGLLWGWQWTPNQANGHTQLLYSFPTSTAAYGYSVTGFEPFNAAQRAAASRAIANYDAVCNVDFAFTANGAAGNIRFAEANSFGFTHGLSKFIWNPNSHPAFGLAPDDFIVLPAAQGDTWFNHTLYNAPTMGSFGYYAGILHEMGHALGLKHGHMTQEVHAANGTILRTNPALPAVHDGLEYSVMTYRAYPFAPLTLAFPAEGPSTLMQDDLYALQWMYGVNYAHNAGNTTYRWNSTTGEMSVNGVGMGVPFHHKVLMTVWDGGGNDTYDFSNFHTSVRVDLQPGGWSTPSNAMLVDLDSRASVTHLARGCIANALAFIGDYHCYIEKAWGGSGNDVLIGNQLDNELRGNGGNDTLNGLGGNDILNGGAGIDKLYGLTGSDAYFVDNAGDVVNETGGNGIDGVVSSISFSLANIARVFGAVENLKLLGAGNINGIGNALNNVIGGNAGANVLSGAAGNDIVIGDGGNDLLYGGAGNDTLAGGAGYDHFVFNAGLNASSNVDFIADFNVAQDTVRLENAVMPGLGAHVGTLFAANFWKSATGLAHDGNDRIIYETDTGKLNYDSNGSAVGGAVHIATLNPNLALTHADFFVI